MFEQRQKPMARAGAAWGPGGRTAQKALANSPRITASTAAIPAPAACSAASALPEPMAVSPSITTCPSPSGRVARLVST